MKFNIKYTNGLTCTIFSSFKKESVYFEYKREGHEANRSELVVKGLDILYKVINSNLIATNISKKEVL